MKHDKNTQRNIVRRCRFAEGMNTLHDRGKKGKWRRQERETPVQEHHTAKPYLRGDSNYFPPSR